MAAISNAFVDLLKGKKSKEEEDHTKFEPLDPFNASKHCLKVYLDPVKRMLCRGYIQQGSCVYTLAYRVVHITQSLSHYWLSDQCAQEKKLDLKGVGSYLKLRMCILLAKD